MYGPMYKKVNIHINMYMYLYIYKYNPLNYMYSSVWTICLIKLVTQILGPFHTSHLIHFWSVSMHSSSLFHFLLFTLFILSS